MHLFDNRFIDMSATQASEGSGRDGGDTFGQNVTYTVSFDLGTAHTNLEGIVVQFCFLTRQLLVTHVLKQMDLLV